MTCPVGQVTLCIFNWRTASLRLFFVVLVQCEHHFIQLLLITSVATMPIRSIEHRTYQRPAITCMPQHNGTPCRQYFIEDEAESFSTSKLRRMPNTVTVTKWIGFRDEVSALTICAANLSNFRSQICTPFLLITSLIAVCHMHQVPRPASRLR